MTAPSPNVAESESWAMLPTLATIIIARAGHAIIEIEDPFDGAGRRRTTRGCLCCHVARLVGSGRGGAASQPVVSVPSIPDTRSS